MNHACHDSISMISKNALPKPLTTPLIFSHANGFPASTYRKLFGLLEEGFDIQAIEKYGHDPQLPVTNNWPNQVDELLALLHATSAQEGLPKTLLVGHSLGGFLSVMAAHKAPHLVRGVILLDSPIVAGWRALALRIGKATGLAMHLSPAKLSKTRRMQWDSVDAAYAHFVSKQVFARWDKDMLHDYARQGTLDDGHGKRILAFEREVETKIYCGLPDHIGRLVRAPFPVPLAFIGGSMSDEVKQVGMATTQHATQGKVSWVAGSHLFPMERPEETAKAIRHFASDFEKLNAAAMSS
jgi:pimeloyl-ACP methyl ester carboxylesterase